MLRAVAILTLLLASPALADKPRPHIVFILADDLGPGDLRITGGEIAKTPNLDRLAEQGTRFTNYYSAAPICSPSRCGLITGMFPARWRITSFLQTKAGNRGCEQDDYLDPAAPSLPRALREAGYATAHVGKWHLGGGRDVVDAPKFAAYGYDLGIGTYESPEPHPEITATNWIWSDKDPVKRWDRTRFFVDQTLDFIEKHKDQPCFVNLWLDDVHTPWVPEPAMEAQPKGDTRRKLVRVIGEMDRQLGRLAERLPKNTLLIFTSDNGALPTFQGARSAGLRGSKLSLYEGGIRMPLIVRWPEQVRAGRVDDTTVVGAVDMFPTLCKIAGAKLPEAKFDGEDMSRALLGEPVERRSPLLWEYGRNNESFKYAMGRDRSPNLAIREGKWKLLVQSDGSGAELYDVVADRAETMNVGAQEPEVVTRLKEKVLKWRKELLPTK